MGTHTLFPPDSSTRSWAAPQSESPACWISCHCIDRDGQFRDLALPVISYFSKTRFSKYDKSWAFALFTKWEHISYTQSHSLCWLARSRYRRYRTIVRTHSRYSSGSSGNQYTGRENNEKLHLFSAERKGMKRNAGDFWRAGKTFWNSESLSEKSGIRESTRVDVNN